MVTIAAVATGFVPAPLLATAPVAWPLVVMAPGSRTLLASRLPHQTCARVARVVLMVAPPPLVVIAAKASMLRSRAAVDGTGVVVGGSSRSQHGHAVSRDAVPRALDPTSSCIAAPWS